MATSNDDFLQQAEAESQAVELDQHVQLLTERFQQCAAKFYGMSGDAQRAVFTGDEQASFKRTLEAEDGWRDEARFLNDAFMLNVAKTPDGSGGASACGLQPVHWYTSVAQWQQWFSHAREIGRGRKRTLQTQRLSHLAQQVELFDRRAADEAYADYFPSDHQRVLGTGRKGNAGAESTDRAGLASQQAIRKAAKNLPPHARHHYEDGKEKPKSES